MSDLILFRGCQVASFEVGNSSSHHITIMNMKIYKQNEGNHRQGRTLTNVGKWPKSYQEIVKIKPAAFTSYPLWLLLKHTCKLQVCAIRFHDEAFT